LKNKISEYSNKKPSISRHKSSSKSRGLSPHIDNQLTTSQKIRNNLEHLARRSMEYKAINKNSFAHNEYDGQS